MNTKRILAALTAAILLVLGSASGAFATFFYPPADMSVSAESPVAGGSTFSGSVTANRECDWTITFDGPSGDGPVTGHSAKDGGISFSFSTNAVDADTVGTVTATCDYVVGFYGKQAANAKASTFGPASMTRSADVTVTAGDDTVTPPTDNTDPPTNNGGGNPGGFILPNTGGPSLWLAIAGAALTLLGAGAVVRSRRTTA